MLGFFSDDMLAGVEGLRERKRPIYPSSKQGSS
jgi:hypothetical protein